MPTIADDGALVYVADLVTAAIAAEEFDGLEERIVERSYPNWDLELQDAGQLRIDVVPVNHVTDLFTRGGVSYRVTVDIGIRKRFGLAEQEAISGRVELAEIDRLVRLVEEIHELLCGYSYRDLAADITWMATDITDTYVAAHLREWRQFTGLIRATFKVHKALATP